MNKKYDAIVLEAGGIKGISFLGFLDILYNELANNNYISNVKYIAGTSCGSAIGYLLCIGYTPREIFLYITTNDILDIFSNFSLISLPTDYGFVDTNIFKKYLELMTIKKIGYIPTFNDLYLKFGKFFMCPAYNINGSRKEECQQYFSLRTHGNMNALDAVVLSCSIPIIFTKSVYNNNIYIDGGLFDSCPVKKLMELCNFKEENILCLRFNSENKDRTISSVYYYVKRILESLMENTRQEIIKTDNIDIIDIDTGIGQFEFNLDKIKRMSMFLKGQDIAKKYYCNIDVQTHIEISSPSQRPEVFDIPGSVAGKSEPSYQEEKEKKD